MDRLVYWIYRTIGFAVRPCPVALVFRAGYIIGRLGYFIAGPYRRLALRNLEIAFPEKSPAERRSLARRHFGNLVGNLLTSLKIATLPREEIRKLITVEGWEIVEQQLAAKRPMVGLISHIGNWELLAQVLPMLFPPPIGTIYQKLGNRYIDAEVRAARQRQGMRIFERKEGFQGAIKTVREGNGVGVLMDQHAGDAGIWCPFFGRLASTSPLGATLALRADAVVVPIAVHTVSPGRWRVVIDPVLESAGKEMPELTIEINRALETQIRRQPEDWFWVHNRWKTPKPKFLLATYKRGIASDAPLPDDAPFGAAAPQGTASALQPFRIVIRSSNWLGDAVMSVPAVRAIKRGRPDAHVTILTPAKLADVWKSVPEVDALIEIAPKESVFSVAQKVRRGRFEAAILFPNSMRVALEAWLAGVPRRVGYPGHRRRWLLDQIFREKKKNKKARQPEHQVHHYLRIADFVGADISEAERLIATASSHRVPAPGEPLRLALCPGAEYGPAKRWLPERFAETMTQIAASRSCEWALVGVAKDAPIADEILQQFSGTARNLVGKTSLVQLIEELRNCHLLLTNDTGTMHLAALLGVPLVAVFGSTEPTLTGPLGDRHRVVRHHVACSPCFKRECPIDFRCMKQVETAQVVQAVVDLLREAGMVAGSGS